ncbi:hypothetical protein SHELI_v1c08100 [Spiroplasma helicoides]|uniref:Uncharacterized protein n=1 Tax=Spiroplasma helicoides TaxID=216938 RepID=A0A1B3SLE8_9MOLU|nr:hypothetical protein [Spiroplasma helicoides]AOG60759.1 hypothetical protein SHELI_v1c08100 [Spiroplasma helicoides]
MGIGKKKKSASKSEYAKLEEERVPNHWTYNDDPLLNREPVFADDSSAPSFDEATKEFVANSSNEETTEIAAKLEKMRKNIHKENKQKPKGILSSIIDKARSNSSRIQNEILENDPIIAKLHRIEELKKHGGSAASEDLYTDLSKSKNNMSYSTRIKEFNEKNSVSEHTFETDLARKLRLSKEAQEKREQAKSFSFSNGKSEENEQRPFFSIPQRKSINQFEKASQKNLETHLDYLEDELKHKINYLKLLKKEKAEKDAEESLNEFKSKKFASNEAKEKYLTKKIKEIEELIKKNS